VIEDFFDEFEVKCLFSFQITAKMDILRVNTFMG